MDKIPMDKIIQYVDLVPSPGSTVDIVHPQMCDWAEGIFLEHGSVHGEVWLLVAGERPHAQMLLTSVANGREKATLFRLLREGIEQFDITIVSRIAEAWGAVISNDTAPELANLRPAQREDRVEMLIVMTVDREGEQGFSQFAITPMPDGTRALGRCETIGAVVETNMTELFNYRRVLQ